MKLKDQILFKENPKEYIYLKQNSNYYKALNRGNIDYYIFKQEMKKKYKERISDKLESAVDNIDLISSILDILK